MVSIDADVDTDAIGASVGSSSGGVSISGGDDPGDITVDIDDGGGGGGGTGPGPGGTGIPGAPTDQQPDTSGSDGGDGGGGDAGADPGDTGPGPGGTGIPGAPEDQQPETSPSPTPDPDPEVGDGGGGRGGGLTREEIARATESGRSDYYERVAAEQGLESRGDTETLAVYDEETGRATGRTNREIASELEERVLDQNPHLREEDVRITRDGRTFRAELTPQGRLRDDRLGRRLGVSISAPAGGFGSTRGGTPGGEADMGDVAISGTSKPLGGFESVRGGTPEGDVSRAEVSTSFKWTSQPSGGLETTRGGSPGGETGRRRAPQRASVPSNIRGQTSAQYRRLDEQIDRQAGMDLTPGVDYTVSRREGPGGSVTLQPELTDAGRRRLRGDEFEREVRDVPLPNPLAFVDRDQPATFAVPFAAFPGVSERDATLEDVSRGTSREIQGGFERAFEPLGDSRVAAGVGAFNPFVGSFVITEKALELAGRSPTEPGESLVGPFYGKGLGALASAPTGLVTAAEETREFGVEAAEVGQREGFGFERIEEEIPAGILRDPATRARPGTDYTFDADGPTVTRERVAIADEGLATFVGEETAETSGQVASDVAETASTPGGAAGLAGGLVFSAAVMGGAGAVSSRAGTATRYAIQPGEELLSAGATRVAPRVAARFPGGRIDWEEPVVYGAARGAERAAGAVRRGRRAVGRGAARARDVASRTRVEPRAGSGFVPPRLRTESASESSTPTRIGTGDLSWERATSVPPGEGSKGGSGPTRVPRKPEKAGIDQQGAFVGSYSETGGQTYFRRTESIDMSDDPFATGQQVPPWLEHRTDLQQAAARRRIAADRRPLFEAATAEEEEASYDALLVAEEVERVEAAQASTFAEPGEEPAAAVTLRGSLAGAGAGLAFGGMTMEAAETGVRERQEQAEASTLRERLAEQADQRSGAEAREAVRQEGRQELRQRQDTALENRQELRFDQEVETRHEAEQEVEEEVLVEMVGLESRIEFPPELGGGPDPRQTPSERGREYHSFAPAAPLMGGRSLEPGWIRETFVDIGTEGSLAAFGSRPPQADLEAASRERRAVGALPTYLELYGTEEQRRRINRAEALFTSSVAADAGFDIDGFGFGDGDAGGFGLDFDLNFEG